MIQHLTTPAVPATPTAAGASGVVAPAPAAAPAPVPAGGDDLAHLAPNERFKALSKGNRAQLDLVKQAQADAKLGTPEALAAFARQTDAHVAWLAERAARPEHAALAEYFRHWLGGAADLWLAARPLPTLAARQARYAELDARARVTGGEADRALLLAAAKELAATSPKLAPGTPSAQVRAALAPAIGHLARSNDPVAQELAKRIEAGEIPFKVTTGGKFGVQYFAMVAVRGINVSNGDVGPDFFALSPPYQAAVLRHEYTHVKQKTGIGGWLAAMGGNLAQRGLALAGRIPGVDADRMDTLGRRWNGSEQEAYRAEKAFLVELGWGDRGMNAADAGMLEGVNYWLEAAAPDPR